MLFISNSKATVLETSLQAIFTLKLFFYEIRDTVTGVPRSRRSATVGSWGGAVSYGRSTPLGPLIVLLYFRVLVGRCF